MLNRGHRCALSLDIRNFIRRDNLRRFSNLLIIADIIWMRSLSSFSCRWTRQLRQFLMAFLVLHPYMRLRADWDLNGGGAFLGNRVFLYKGRTTELKSMHTSMMSWDALVQILTYPCSRVVGNNLLFEYWIYPCKYNLKWKISLISKDINIAKRTSLNKLINDIDNQISDDINDYFWWYPCFLYDFQCSTAPFNFATVSYNVLVFLLTTRYNCLVDSSSSCCFLLHVLDKGFLFFDLSS